MLNRCVMATGLALAFAVPAHADFRWELGANYFTGDTETNATAIGATVDTDIDIFGANGSWFLESVDTSKGPLSEAAFLDRASRVDVLASDGELDFDFDDVDITSYGVGGRYVLNKESGWLIDASYTYTELDNFESDSFTIGGGKYLRENTLVTLSYTYTDPDQADDVDTFTIAAEHLQELPLGSLKAEAAYAYADPGDSSDIDNYLARVIYYPMNNIGVGGRWERIVSGSSSDNWSLFAEWFFMENIALSVEYRDFERTSGIPNIDGDGVFASALYRF